MPKGIYIKWDVAKLREEYLGKGKSISKIAREMRVAYASVNCALTRLGISKRPRGTDRLGEKHWNWKGGRAIANGRSSNQTYIMVKAREHHHANKQGYVMEHILVWEQVHNKSLPAGWVVHHLNGVKSDNRPCNLVALRKKEHYLILAEKAKKIRELEAENAQLRRALEANQAIFYINEN